MNESEPHIQISIHLRKMGEKMQVAEKGTVI